MKMDIASGSIALGYAFAGLGYLIGLFLLSSPYTSKSMKAKGNEMMEYSVICSFYLSLCYVVYGLSNQAYITISSLLGGKENLIGGGSLLGVADWYYNKWGEQLFWLFSTLAVPTLASLIPLVGAIVSLVLLVAFSPFVLLFGLTSTTFLSVAITFYIFAYLTPILFFIGSALIPAPLKIGKKIGGLLIASSLVFTALGPAIPTIADIISKNAFKLPELFNEDILSKEAKKFVNIYTGAKFETGNTIMDLLRKIFLDSYLNIPYAFAIGTLIAMLFLVVAIESVSEGIGGAGEKIIEV
jgi:hypothetical protein